MVLEQLVRLGSGANASDGLGRHILQGCLRAMKASTRRRGVGGRRRVVRG